MTENPDAPLRRDQAAEYIRAKFNVPCTRSLLAKLATLGGGPAFHKFSRFPLYEKSNLDAWVQGKIERRVQPDSEARTAA